MGLRVRVSRIQGLGYPARLGVYEFGFREYRSWVTLQGYGPASSGYTGTGVGLPREARGLRVRVPRVQEFVQGTVERFYLQRT